MLRIKINANDIRSQIRNFSIGNTLKISKNGESPRMQEFHKRLQIERQKKTGSRMRFVDLVLVETNPENGELIPNYEENPTKWGDWQHGGRVTDF